ncbi:class I SAM-dependent methyltransferase [Phycisphaera mikurensis]|nr:methyltransferase domain-containing protein [Phycisphaera mikurensis]MBB6441834.1 tRNA (mo5U34)-methyltransferase [Phycisphaera mikurensis]
MPELQQRIDELAPWFHNLHLPDGTGGRVQTCPDHPLGLGDFPAWKFEELSPHLPADLAGLAALDIGCNAGYYAFALAERGARVTAIDHDPRYLAQARLAQESLDPRQRVRFEQADVYDLLHREQAFDVVLFLGVLYHLRYPLLALDAIARRVKPGGTLFLQTLTAPGPDPARSPAIPDDVGLNDRELMTQPHFPRLAFIEHRWAGDPTNWFAFDAAAVEAVLRSCGYEQVERLTDELWRARKPGEAEAPWWDRGTLDRIAGKRG